MPNDIPLMRAMFLIGAAYAAKAVREALTEDNIPDMFPVSAVAEAAAEIVAGRKPTENSKFDLLMHRLGVPDGPGSAVSRLIDQMRLEASDREMTARMNRFKMARKIGNAATVAKYRAELAELLASEVDVPVEF